MKVEAGYDEIMRFLWGFAKREKNMRDNRSEIRKRRTDNDDMIWHSFLSKGGGEEVGGS